MIRKHIAAFIISFISAFIAAAIVTYVYARIFYEQAQVNWHTTFTLALLVAGALTAVRIFTKEKQ